MKKKKVSNIVDKLKKKFQLSIFNESTLESVFSLHISRLDGIFMGASLVIILFFLSFLLLKYTPLGAFMPNYMETNVRKQMTANAYRVDSLSEIILKQTHYIDVVKGIIAGDIVIDPADTEGHRIPMDTLAKHHLELMKPTKNEQAFREVYEESERYNLSTLNTQELKSVLLFYPPVKGDITSVFNASLRKYGVDVKVSNRQAVLSVLAGTVIFADYLTDYRFVIQIQHANDYVSVYKYNTELLKQQGDVVKAGEAIAIVGKVVGSEETPHVFFELWQNGIAQNPEEFILF